MFWMNNQRKHYLSYTVDIKFISVGKARISNMIVFHFFVAGKKMQIMAKVCISNLKKTTVPQWSKVCLEMMAQGPFQLYNILTFNLELLRVINIQYCFPFIFNNEMNLL